MKRRVIQIANSTQLISLPRAWAKRNNVQKGQELDIQEDGNKVIINAGESEIIESEELNVSDLGPMLPRVIYAMYKKGVDELKLTFDQPEVLATVQYALRKETIGYEILEQGKTHCIIKNVSGTVEDFDPLLRRTFLLLIELADNTYDSLKTKNFSRLKNVAFLEEANNRFTTVCRRYLNKTHGNKAKYVGPLYYIVEDLENIADYYKFICRHFEKLDPKTTKISKELMDFFLETNRIFKLFYALFYKFDKDKLVEIRDARDKMVIATHSLYKKRLSPAEVSLLCNVSTIMQKIFCLLGPYMILAL